MAEPGPRVGLGGVSMSRAMSLALVLGHGDVDSTIGRRIAARRSGGFLGSVTGGGDLDFQRTYNVVSIAFRNANIAVITELDANYVDLAIAHIMISVDNELEWQAALLQIQNHIYN